MARVTIDQTLNAAEQLPPDEREELIRLVQRRLVEERLAISDARMVEEEFQQGLAVPTTAKAMMREICG